ncbi:MAG: hypothetical protein ACKJSG_16135 [Lentisphaeria bacterium]
MGFEIDTELHWTEHYVEHGFCVIKQAVPEKFCTRALAALQEALETTLPPNEWTAETIDPELVKNMRTRPTPEAESIYDEPGLLAILEAMFGTDNEWSGVRSAGAFISLHDPANQPEKPQLVRWGHVDFVDRYIPVFGDGFTCQVSLVKSEPFSGNITIYPGWHKLLQKAIAENPDFRFFKDSAPSWQAILPQVEPYEFVADPGDILLFHHLVGHGQNFNYCASGMPRVCIHFLAMGKTWLNGIDPSVPDLSPWKRSHAHNGKIDLPHDDKEMTISSKQDRAKRKATATK